MSIAWIRAQLFLSFRAITAEYLEAIPLKTGERRMVTMIIMLKMIKLSFFHSITSLNLKLSLTRSMKLSEIIIFCCLVLEVAVIFILMMENLGQIPIIHNLENHFNYQMVYNIEQKLQNLILQALMNLKWKS
jgi:hypothetical protein